MSIEMAGCSRHRCAACICNSAMAAELAVSTVLASQSAKPLWLTSRISRSSMCAGSGG